ncbi:MAG: 4-hydroxybutyrate CoA-transferase [Gammaproteobacteria bacterium]|nr:4-hydroxybutyrate CoA-transferase [Gammaproteobacteria bacterium]
MDYRAEYEDKLTTAEKAAQYIPQSGHIGIGMAMSAPPALLNALEKRVLQQEIEELNLYYLHSTMPLTSTLLKYPYMGRIKPHPFFMGAAERELIHLSIADNKRAIFFMPCNFSEVPKIIQNYLDLDTFIMTVSPMDKGGYFSCGTNSDYTIPAARMAKKLIVEVNEHMPRAAGNCSLHLSEIDVLIENNTPLCEVPAKPIGEIDKELAKQILHLIPDKATLQFGIGSVPNALCVALSSHRDLGLHTELISPRIVDLIECGAITNRFKNINPHKSVYTFALGDKAMYDFLNDNSSMECYPVDYVNDPYTIAQNDRVVSINSFVQVDLFGQVNAECVKGKQFSAVGGQLDFIRGAQLSRGGCSILVAHSTAMEGSVSRIVPMIEGPITDSRVDVQYIATEYGIVNLKGKSTYERAMALIDIAHPKFRDELWQQAKTGMGLKGWV